MEANQTYYLINAAAWIDSTVDYFLYYLTNESGSRLVNQNGDYLVATVYKNGYSLHSQNTNYVINSE